MLQGLHVLLLLIHCVGCLAREMTPNESSELQSIVPCATALFKVEDTCMTICGTILKHLLAGGDQGQMAVFELQKTLMQGIDNIQVKP